MYLKLAWGNVRRSVRDYSVYFATLAFAACLLYAFTASGDYLLAVDLTDEQRELCAKSGGIMQAFSVFVVIVFVFLVAYANRFLVRRRKREFGIYALLGMRSAAVSFVLVVESGLVGVASLAAGLAAGAGLSPVFGGVAAFVFGVPWKPVFVWSPASASWTSACFACIMICAGVMAARDVRKRPLVELMYAASRGERQRLGSRLALRAQLGIAVVLLVFVWGTCLFNPVMFISLILPMGFIALFGTYFLLRVAAARGVARSQKNEQRYLNGLRMLVVRQLAAKVESSSMALACVCVLVAAGVCMMSAGLAFSVGMRAGADTLLSANTLAPIGYVGVFYGLTFLVAAAAVLALQQLTEAADNRRAYDMLNQLGADASDKKLALCQQVGVYFAAPVALAFVHDVFGLVLVGFLAYIIGSSAYVLIAGATLLVTLVLMGGYYALTCAACNRMLIGRYA